MWLAECTVDCLWLGLSPAELMLISLLGKSACFALVFVQVCVYKPFVCVLLLRS